MRINTPQIIKALKAIDLSNVEIDYLRKKINLLFKNYTHTSIILPQGWGKLHRAIKYEKKPLNKTQLSYPPTINAKLGRANLTGNSVFYCSGDPRATFFELGAKSGDTIVLSKWIILNEILIFPIGYSEQVFKSLLSNRECPIIVPPSVRAPNEIIKSNIKINEFFAEKFTQIITQGNEHHYNLTATIAETFMCTATECGLVYPTIAMRANTENFVLTKELVDQCLKLVMVKWCRIDEVNGLDYKLTILECADNFNTNGEIKWRSPTQEEKKYL